MIRKFPLAIAAIRCGVALTLLAGCAAAQDQNLQSVVRFQVKPDRMGEFESAVKELHAVFQKAGYDRHNTIWQSAAGPMEYVLVNYSAKYSDMFGSNSAKLKEVQGSVTALTARILSCTNSMDRRISEVLTDVSLPRQSVPPFIRTIRSDVKMGKLDEYIALLKQTIAPAMKKAGVPAFIVFRQRYGGSTSQIVSSTGLNSLADLDQSPSAVVAAMGDATYKQYLAKRNELVDSSEINIYRYRKDLSYQPAGTVQPSGANR